MEFLKRVLAFIRSIPLAAIGKTALARFNFFVKYLGGLILKAAEKILDQKIKDAEDNLETKIKDREIEADRRAKADAINKAKTDAEFDDAVRDSLR